VLDSSTGEAQGVAVSCAAAAALWFACRRLVHAGRVGRILLVLEAVAIAKVALGLWHFYALVLPSVGLDSSERLEVFSFTDMTAIHAAARTFQPERARPRAVFGDFSEHHQPRG
jgi:hypothetical protein